MKKIVLFLVACMALSLQCMEQSPTSDMKDEMTENSLGVFSNLPDELLVHLFSFAPEATSIKEIHSKLALLSLIHPKFKTIVEDQAFIKQLVKRYYELHPELAQERMQAAQELIDFQYFLGKKQLITEKVKNEACSEMSFIAHALTLEEKNQLLHSAAATGYQMIMDLLLSRIGRNDNNAVQKILNSLLICASQHGKLEIVKDLLQKGADVNGVNQEGYCALIAASREGYKKVVELLLDKKANVNAVTNRGNTALIGAVEFHNEEIARLLVARGADDEIRNSNGETAYDHALANYNRLITGSDWLGTMDFLNYIRQQRKLVGYLGVGWI